MAASEPCPTCLPPTSEMFQDTTVQYHDASGNVERTAREERFVVGEEEDQWAYREGSWNFYAADQKLVARQVNRDTLEIVSGFMHVVRDRWGVWEEYEYDALGRRIRKEVNRGPELCDRTTCISATERYIWDGDQLLYETRSGGGGETQNGTVGYTHGLGLDAPLDLMRQNSSYTDDRAVIPHTNWRGDFASGTFADSAEAFDCVVLGCNVAWPAGNQSAFLFDGKGFLSDWMGSLWESMRDESGLMYRRNRYYDPLTGQFTQQDPIGLAGGLNLYGFANGDPVNFQDPFGVCPVPPWDCPPGYFTALGAGGGAVAGGLIGGGVGVVVAAPTGELAAPVTVPGFSLGGAYLGAKIGALGGAILDVGVALAGSVLFADDSRTADQIISDEKIGSIRREFPGEMLDKTLSEIEQIAGTKKHAQRSAAKKAKKLLTDKRFNKPE